jgi:hypothetical protein
MPFHPLVGDVARIPPPVSNSDYDYFTMGTILCTLLTVVPINVCHLKVSTLRSREVFMVQEKFLINLPQILSRLNNWFLNFLGCS